MQAIDLPTFKSALKGRVSKRLERELRFTPDTIADWPNREMLAISTRSGNEGVLVVELEAKHYYLPYERGKSIADSATGRSKAITCDLCYTWQRGSKAASITFTRRTDKNTVTFLCCADLQCSLHIRNMTPESHLSRAQLHEDITTERRINRLQHKLASVIETLREEAI